MEFTIELFKEIIQDLHERDKQRDIVLFVDLEWMDQFNKALKEDYEDLKIGIQNKEL